ncbi:MAG: NAD(P)/FAD-dependent oxidoreductase [Clostridia bacterium]
MRACVIGGGASGMLCALELKNNDIDTVLFEKNEKLGKKLYITGKGRCNLTNDCDEKEFLDNVLRNGRFMYGAIYGFNSAATMNYFENLGVTLKVERGNRVFPMSDKSNDIIKALTNGLKTANVDIRLNNEVSKIEKNGEVFFVTANGVTEKFDKVVVATGGITYFQTGSTGDGYKFAKKFNHEIVPPKGVLIGLKTKENFDLSGLTLKNVTFNVEKNGKLIFSEQGEMLFTHEGVSGPIVLTASSAIAREKLRELSFYIDLKPALSDETLDNRLLRDFEKNVNKQFKSSLNELLPSRLIGEVIKQTKIDGEKRVNSITKEERGALLNALKKFKLTIVGSDDENEGIITCGGVDVKSINPKNMESKLCDGLYFIGETLDVDAKTGGFNLQIAFATAYACAKGIAATKID